MNSVESPRPILLISPWPSKNNGVAWYTGKYKEAIERHGRTVETRRMVFWQEKHTFWKWISFLRDIDRIRPSSVLIQHTPTGSGPLLLLPFCLIGPVAAIDRVARVMEDTLLQNGETSPATREAVQQAFVSC